MLAPERAPKRILASLSHKAMLLDKLGCKLLVVQEFNLEFAASDAREFIESIATACPQLKSISVGEDWQFGKGRAGNVESLTQWGKELGFEVFAPRPS